MLIYIDSQCARETLGNPGISIVAPEITTKKPAPVEGAMSVMWSVHPV
jgi:hypothetical protein